MIEVDDFGYSDVSWNNPAMITPELEKLAGAGVILDTFYTAPRCSPSRWYIMEKEREKNP